MLRTTLAIGTLVTGSAAAAHLTYYTVDIQPLNGSNVTGNAVLIVDSNENTLTVNVNAFNVEPDQDHLTHIHGRFDAGGAPINSFSPTLADDADGDGFIEVLEGLPQYGDILLPLATQNDSLGLFSSSETFDLTDDSLFFSPVSGKDYQASDLFPLNFRELVIHGKTVATGEIVGVPEPGSLALLGLGGLLIARRRRA